MNLSNPQAVPRAVPHTGQPDCTAVMYMVHPTSNRVDLMYALRGQLIRLDRGLSSAPDCGWPVRMPHVRAHVRGRMSVAGRRVGCTPASARSRAHRCGADYSRGQHNPANGLPGLWIVQI